MYKGIKKVLLLALVLCSLILNIETVKAAPNAITVSSNPTLLPGYVGGTKFYMIPLTDGTITYCLNIHKEVPRSATLHLKGEMDAGIAYLLENGYPHKRFVGDARKDYYITQTAIWWYLDQTTGTKNLTDAFKTKSADPSNLRPHIINLVNGAVAARNRGYITPTMTMNTTSNKLELTSDKKYYESKEIEVVANALSSDIALTVKTSLKGVTLVNKNGTKITTTKAKEPFKIRVPASSMEGTSADIKVLGSATGVVNKAYEYLPTNNTLQNLSPSILYPTTTKLNASLDFNISTSIVKIIKIDEKTKQPLKGALLVLKNAEGKVITSWLSTDKVHQITNLPNGTYHLSEEKAPEGYKINKDVTTFQITDKNRDITVQISNAPKSNVVSILKIDASTKEPLAGATLQVKDSKGNVVARFTTTEEAYILKDLEEGEYTVEEEQAPLGYETNNEKKTFIIDKDHTAHQIVFENYKTTIVPPTSASSMLPLLGLLILLSGIGLVYYHAKKQA